MVKKLAALAGAGAILLFVAAPALANGWWWHEAIVENSAEAVSNTGMNTQDNYAKVRFGGLVLVDGASGDRTMTTGDASAKAKAVVKANTHIGCDPCAGDGPHHEDFAFVGNGAYAEANTGLNAQDDLADVENDGEVLVDGGLGDRTLTTGNAWSKAKAYTIVNAHLSF